MSGKRRSVLFVNPFDAHAGSQRIGRAVVAALEGDGAEVSVRLGFGGRGFLSELPQVDPDVRCDNVPVRKLLYPLWALVTQLGIAWASARGRIIWANTVYSLPPALLAILLFPRSIIVHVHEATFPRLFGILLRLAAWRGATIVCVSADQAQRLGVVSRILPNPVVQPLHDGPSRRDRLLFVGTTQPIKGFDLFVSVCNHLSDFPLRKAAYLSDESRCDRALVSLAGASGIEIIFGESAPEAMYADGFLVLICTDPRLFLETFSLVAAEAASRLVPVGGAGVTVLSEVLGDALAFDDPSRNPQRIARAIADLHRDPARVANLRQACEARRIHFSEAVFAARIAKLLELMEVS